MLVWFTRSDLWDCISKGIGRCQVWLARPVFDVTPVGAADPLYPQNPIGWKVPFVGEGAWQLSMQVNDCLDEHPEIALALFAAVSRSIDGKEPRDGMYLDWSKLLDSDEYDDRGRQEFLLELEVPPTLWWSLARRTSGETLGEAHRRQALLTSDVPF